MYSQADFSVEIERNIPTLHKALHTPECEKSIYKQADVLSHYLAEQLEDKELKEVKRTLYLADKLYESGSNIVKGAIENVFVFSFSHILLRAGGNRQKFLALMPVTLFTLYINQVLHRGC